MLVNTLLGEVFLWLLERLQLFVLSPNDNIDNVHTVLMLEFLLVLFEIRYHLVELSLSFARVHLPLPARHISNTRTVSEAFSE